MDDSPLARQKSLSPVVAFAAASALGAILIIVGAHHLGLLSTGQGVAQAHQLASSINLALRIPPVPPHHRVTADQLLPVVPAVPTNFAPPKPAFVALIAQGVADLGVKPKTVTLPNEQALEEVADLKRGDYAAAGRLVADVLARSKLDGWQFAPFTAFMGSLTHGNDPALLQSLNEWVRREPKSVLPYLVRADYYSETGWNLRGTNVASMIPPEIYAMFEANQESAEADLRQSITLNPHVPWSYFQLLRAVSSDGDDSEVQDVFQQGIKAYPGYYALYKQRLYMLTPKWGGSPDDMYAFAAQYAGKAPDVSPLKFLYLSVYSNVLDDAWFDCSRLQGDALNRCVDGTLKSQKIPKEINEGVVKALNLYKVSDPIGFSQAIWPVLSSMASSPGSGASGFGQILQNAASIMGSNNGLNRPPGHNSYMLDDVTAQVWARSSYLENAEQKYHDALADIEQTSFHDEAERDEAATTVLNHLANLYQSNSQWLNAIIAFDAAESVGGVNFTHEPFQKCQALYKLKRFPEAVIECTRVQKANNNFDAVQYYLGRSYENLQQWDTALSVLAPVALATDDYRDSSAIAMSIVYGRKNDFAGELRSLNEHGYLFDTSNRDNDDLSVAFNNRCHALMQLGRLQEALNDCNISLKFAQLPEAVRKQQELLKMLAHK